MYKLIHVHMGEKKSNWKGGLMLQLNTDRKKLSLRSSDTPVGLPALFAFASNKKGTYVSLSNTEDTTTASRPIYLRSDSDAKLSGSAEHSGKERSFLGLVAIHNIPLD